MSKMKESAFKPGINNGYKDFKSVIHNKKYIGYKVTNNYLAFPDGQKIQDLPILSKEHDYWYRKYQKLGFNDISAEEANLILEKKEKKLKSYFIRLQNFKLKRKHVCKPKKPLNYSGIYFPCPKEIKRIKKFESSFLWSGEARNQRKFIKRVVGSVGKISILKRWKEFQEIYKIYDLRPLIGMRCLYYEENVSETGFVSYRLLNDTCYRQFLDYIGRDLPDVQHDMILSCLGTICDLLQNGQYQVLKTKEHVSGLDLRLMEAINKKYGSRQGKLMESFIGKLDKFSNARNEKLYLEVHNIPFKLGKFSREEDMQLIKNILYFQKNILFFQKKINNLNDIIKSNNIPWRKIFENMKTRHKRTLEGRWITLKQDILNCENNLIYTADLTEDNIVEMIELIYNQVEVNFFDEIDWEGVTSLFPLLTKTTIRSKFYYLVKSRVPYKLQRDFNDTIEYLHENMIPVFKLKAFRSSLMKSALTELLDFNIDNIYKAKLSTYFGNYCTEGDDEKEHEMILKLTKSFPSELKPYQHATPLEREVNVLSSDHVKTHSDHQKSKKRKLHIPTETNISKKVKSLPYSPDEKNSLKKKNKPKKKQIEIITL